MHPESIFTRLDLDPRPSRPRWNERLAEILTELRAVYEPQDNDGALEALDQIAREMGLTVTTRTEYIP